MSKLIAAVSFIVGSLLLLVGALWFDRGPIEADLKHRTQQALTDGALAAVSVAFTGRDGQLTGTVPSEAARTEALDRARSVWGVRVVEDGLIVAQPAPNPSATDDDASTARAELQARLDDVLAQSSIRFATGSARLTVDGQRVLDALHAVLQDTNAVRIEVQGHTDNAGSAQRNQRLSQQRADAVRMYLNRLGLPEGVTLTSVGYGETQPIHTNATSEGRRLNRRVALVLQ